MDPSTYFQYSLIPLVFYMLHIIYSERNYNSSIIYSLNLAHSEYTNALWCKGKKRKGLFLYSAVSSPWDCSKRFTIHPLADLFIPRPSHSALSHTTITAQELPIHMSVARYSFTQLSELWQCGVNETAKVKK